MKFRELLNEANSKDIFKGYMVEMLEQFLQSKKITEDKFKETVEKRENIVALQNALVNMIGDLKTSNPKYKPENFDVNLITNGDKNTYDSEWFKMKDAERMTITRKAITEYFKKFSVEVPKENWVK